MGVMCRHRTEGIRDVIADTNAIVWLNCQLREVTKTHRPLPKDQALLKAPPPGDLQPRPCSNTSSATWHWRAAFDQFEIFFPSRRRLVPGRCTSPGPLATHRTPSYVKAVKGCAASRSASAHRTYAAQKPDESNEHRGGFAHVINVAEGPRGRRPGGAGHWESQCCCRAAIGMLVGAGSV